MEKSDEDVRPEKKVESTIASDAACDQCKPNVHLAVILPDPQLYSAHIVAHTLDHTRISYRLGSLSRSIGRTGSLMTSTNSQIRTLHIP